MTTYLYTFAHFDNVFVLSRIPAFPHFYYSIKIAATKESIIWRSFIYSNIGGLVRHYG